MNTFGKEFRNFALKFGKFTIWNKIAIYLELYNYSYSEFADKVINGIIAGGEIVPEKSDKYQLCVRYRGSEYYVWIENLWYAALCSVKKGGTQTEVRQCTSVTKNRRGLFQLARCLDPEEHGWYHQ